MRITITGERSEGKTALALVIHKLLQKYTRYTLTVREVPNEAREFKSALKVKEIKRLSPRYVKIEVAND